MELCGTCRQAFSRAVTSAPDAVVPQLNFAKFEIAQGNPEAALQLLSEAARRDPDSAQLWLLTGTAQNQLQRLHLAASSFRKAIELGP